MKNTVVDFRIIGACHMRCPFCHGAPKEMPQSPASVVKMALNKVWQADVASRVVFSGGEPLLRNDIAELIQYAHETLGFSVYLSTTSWSDDAENPRLIRIYEKIAQHLSCIGLPLDGHNDMLNLQMGRKVGHLGALNRTLEFFDNRAPQHQTKLGTVVSKINLSSILRIGDYVFNRNGSFKPNTWRLYQFVPRGDGVANREKYEITAEEFARVVELAQREFGDIVSPLAEANHDQNYFFVEPNMDLVTCKGTEFPKIGSMLELEPEKFRQIVTSDYSHISELIEENRQWLKVS